MASSRRHFLLMSAGALLALGAGSLAFASKPKPAKAPLKLLIFGGTGFIGPSLVEAARARGHTVTLFNRGKTRPELFSDLEKLRGDRDPNKDEGLKALEGRKWDVVLDDTGYYPRMVGASAALLAPNVQQYIYVSSISAYASAPIDGMDEAAPVATIPDPTVETMGEKFENYGALKALCEQAVEKALPGRTTIVRPGFIVGPNDPTDRFTYWPLRVARGGEMLAPDTPDGALQIIDVRDLAEWMILLAEQKTTGVFNAVGPEKKLTWGEMLETSKKVTGSDTRITWVSSEFIEKRPEQIDTPLWLPPKGDFKGFHTIANGRAIKAGLRFRPAKTTIKDTLDWFRTLPAERQEKVRVGLKPELETTLLAAWHEENKQGR